MAAKVVKTGRQWYVKLKENHRCLLEQVLIAVREFAPPQSRFWYEIRLLEVFDTNTNLYLGIWV
jgi:hypothetical protein